MGSYYKKTEIEGILLTDDNITSIINYILEFKKKKKADTKELKKIESTLITKFKLIKKTPQINDWDVINEAMDYIQKYFYECFYTPPILVELPNMDAGGRECTLCLTKFGNHGEDTRNIMNSLDGGFAGANIDDLYIFTKWYSEEEDVVALKKIVKVCKSKLLKGSYIDS